jgi:hypothetical protein
MILLFFNPIGMFWQCTPLDKRLNRFFGFLYVREFLVLVLVSCFVANKSLNIQNLLVLVPNVKICRKICSFRANFPSDFPADFDFRD